jgi:hypothetical protein
MHRALVCILAQTRSHQLTWSKFQTNVLGNLGGEVDLALCVAEVPDRKSNPFDDVALDKRWRDLLAVRGHFLGGIKDPCRQQPGVGALLRAPSTAPS